MRTATVTPPRGRASAASAGPKPSPARGRQDNPDAGSCCAACRARDRRRAAPRRQKDPEDLAAFAKHMIRLLVRDAFDVAEPSEILPILASINATVDEELHKAVQALRSGPTPYTWEQIGAQLGVRKQSAQERFGGDRG